MMEPVRSSHEGFVCQECGDEGFTNAFVYCVKCMDVAIHRYCLAVTPKTLNERVIWCCDDCQVKSSQSKEAAKSGYIKATHPKKEQKKEMKIDSSIAGANEVICQENITYSEGEYNDGRKWLIAHHIPKKNHTNRKKIPAFLTAKKKKDYNLQNELKSGAEDSIRYSSDKAIKLECQDETGTNVRQTANFENSVNRNCYKHAQPVIVPIWRGSFTVLGTNYDQFKEANMMTSSRHLEMRPETVTMMNTLDAHSPRKNIDEQVSDDDFVTQPPKVDRDRMEKDIVEFKQSKGRQIKSKKTFAKKKKNIVVNTKKKEANRGKKKKLRTVNTINSRQSPAQWVKLLKCLKDDKKKAISDMGFDTMVNCKITTIPNKLGYWVVDHFDEKTCQMQIGDHKVDITKQSVKDILGFPNGEVAVKSVKRAGIGDKNIISDWRKQYPKPRKGTPLRIYMKDVIDMIKKDDSCGRMFKLNIVVLIMSLMAEGIKCATVNQKFLPCIKNVEEIPKMDWCGYVLECLKRSKDEWKRDEEKSWYTGPLLFLVVWFVNYVRCKNEMGENVVPAIDFWDSEKLKKYEAKMLKSGGFGNVKLKDNATLQMNIVVVNEEKQTENRKMVMEKASEEEYGGNRDMDYEEDTSEDDLCTTKESSEEKHTSVEEYVEEIKVVYNKLCTTIKKASKKFLGDEKMKKVIEWVRSDLMKSECVGQKSNPQENMTVKCQSMQVDLTRPTIKSWTSDLLKKRQRAEMKSGGFGKGALERPLDTIEEEKKKKKKRMEGKTNEVK